MKKTQTISFELQLAEEGPNYYSDRPWRFVPFRQTEFAPGVECWEWLGPIREGDVVPLVYLSRERKGQKVKAGRQPVRKLVWLIFCGPAVPAGRSIATTCGNQLCIRPDHLKMVRAEGRPRRGANCKLSPEEVTEIRIKWLKGTSKSQLADEHGIGITTLYRITKTVDVRNPAFALNDEVYPVYPGTWLDVPWPLFDKDGASLPTHTQRARKLDDEERSG